MNRRAHRIESRVETMAGSLTSASASDTLTGTFLPPWLRDALATPSPPPWSRDALGAALWVDLVGFTPLVESYVSQGDPGAEALSGILNDYFGWLIDVVGAHGGEVNAFVGDAAIGLFPVDSSGDEALAMRAAAGCALALQRDLAGRPTRGGPKLSHRVSLAWGRFTYARLGDETRALSLVTGDAIEALGPLHRNAAPGQVLASAEAVARLPAGVRATPAGDGMFTLSGAVNALVHRPFALMATPPGAEAYLPQTVVARVAAGHAEWMAELRVVSALFVSLAWPRASDAIGVLQRTVRDALAEITRYDGCAYQLVLDDKGLTLVALWGLGAQSHEDDAARAVRAGLGVLRGRGETVLGAGVASGRVFCGVYGNDRRRHFACLGSVVNLAARWMSRAQGALLCDAETAHQAANKADFESLGTVEVKGRAERVEVFQARAGRTRTSSVAPKLSPSYGRARERDALTDAIDALTEGRGALVRVSAEAGMGKTLLVQDALRYAWQREVRTLVTAGDPMEQSTAFFPWRSLIAQCLGEAAHDPSAARGRLIALLEYAPEKLALLPLMQALVPLGLAEGESTRALAAAGRLERLQDLVVTVLTRVASERPSALVVDDLQWVDTSSCALLDAVLDRVDGALVVLASRPLASDAAPELHRLFGPRERASDVTLGPLGEQSLASIVARRLGVSAAPEVLLSLVSERAEGHPMYAEEITQALLDRGAVAVRDGAVTTQGLTREVIAALPGSLQRVLASRIDGLPPTEQLAARVASVVGRSFRIELLREVFPVRADLPKLADALETLRARRLTDVDPTAPRGGYVFRHALTQRAAYETLLHGQRQQLHRAVAEALERGVEGAAPSARVLGHHWSQVDAARAVPYLERAAGEAFLNFAYRESVALYEDLLRKADALPGVVSVERRAGWERSLCDAWLKLGDRDQSMAAMFRALSLRGVELPRSRAQTAKETVREVIRQATTRAQSGRPRAVDEARRAHWAEVAMSMHRVTELAWFRQDLGTMTWSTWAGLNYGERGGDSEGLALLTAACCLSVGFAGLHAPAHWYYRRALDLAERVGGGATIAYVRMACGIYDNAMGRWSTADAHWTAASAHNERVGDRYRAIEGRSAVMFQEQQLGRFARAETLADEVDALARFEGGVLGRVQGRSARAGARLALGAVDRGCAEGIEAALADAPPWTEQLIGQATLARVWLALGDEARASEFAQRAVAVGVAHPPLVYFVAPSVALLVEACCALGERSHGAERGRWLTHARTASSMLGGLRWTVGSLRSTFHVAEAECARLAGSGLTQRWHASRALSAAARYANPHDAGRARALVR